MQRLIMIRREPPLALMKQHLEKVESELEPLGGW